MSSGRRVQFEVVESDSERGLGFDPAHPRTGGGVCPFCGTVSDRSYVKAEGMSSRLKDQLMAVACVRSGKGGKTYIPADRGPGLAPDPAQVQRRIESIRTAFGIDPPAEPLPPVGTLGFRVQPYGFKTWSDFFNNRQLLCLMSFTKAILLAESEIQPLGFEHKKATVTFLAAMLDRLADFSSTLCVWNSLGWGESTAHTFGRHALPMTMDYAEINPFSDETAGWSLAIERIVAALSSITPSHHAQVERGSATSLDITGSSIDVVITDPPYYDNVPYADISDFFYVWLKRALIRFYPEHFASALTPKKQEAIAEPRRHGGKKDKANRAYEEMMAQSFHEANRVLKPGGSLVIVYAHKTTLGWATLVDALRKANFIVTEAWPLETEKPGRLRAHESAALASSIFLVARKRQGSAVGSYEEQVRTELERIVRERVDVLWTEGILVPT